MEYPIKVLTRQLIALKEDHRPCILLSQKIRQVEKAIRILSEGTAYLAPAGCGGSKLIWYNE